MNKKLAYHILEITETSLPVSQNEIRDQYKLCALKYHPDKCKLPNATERFQDINDAYQYLKTHATESIDYDIHDAFPDDDDIPMNTHFNTYKELFGVYISRFFQNICGTESKERLAKLAISKIVGLCEKKATEYVRRFDEETLSKIYEILFKYKDAFHISDQWLSVVNDILSEKRKDKTCVILNPFLEDLLADNLYKITENGQHYIVPLWHPELVYDCSGSEFIVRCCPVLPEHMEIDDENNVYVHLEYTLHDLWNADSITVPFGNTQLSFEPKALNITRKPQTIGILGAGISRINQTDMFDNSLRTNVYLIITIV